VRKTINLTDRVSRRLAEAFLPHVVLPLVREGIITEKHLADSKLLVRTLIGNIRKATGKMQWCIAIEASFLNQSILFWRQGERLMAVVLYATAVEQYMNQLFQLILSAQGWKSSQITCLLREVGTDAKLGWMFEAFTKRRFPHPLAQRLRAVFSIRNAIVHFKGEVGHPDRKDDSHSKVEAQMRGLRRMSISRDFRLLEDAFVGALLSVDPDRVLASRAVKAIRAARNERTRA
jgi:hypothetical protein